MFGNLKFLTLLLTIPKYGYNCQEEFEEKKIIGLSRENKFMNDLQDERLILDNNNLINLGNTEGSGSEESILFDLNNNKQKPIIGCVEPGFTLDCSGKGTCVNDKCVCNSTDINLEDNTRVKYSYKGLFCEECPYCNGQRCTKFLPCIECFLIYKNKNCDPMCAFPHKKVKKVVRDIENDDKVCDIETTNGCFVKFKYFYDEHNGVFLEFEDLNFCFNGYKLVIIAFWLVVGYIILISVLASRICLLPLQTKVAKSRTSLSSRHDILRSQL